MPNIKDPKYVFMPLRSVLLFQLTVWLWLMEIVLVAGSVITAGQWPAPIKTYVCLALAVVGAIYHAARPKTFWQELRQQQRSQRTRSSDVALRPMECVYVTGFAIAAGTFGAWLVWGPP